MCPVVRVFFYCFTRVFFCVCHYILCHLYYYLMLVSLDCTSCVCKVYLVCIVCCQVGLVCFGHVVVFQWHMLCVFSFFRAIFCILSAIYMIVCDCFCACVTVRRCLFVFLLVFVGVLLFLLVCVWKGSVAIFSFVCTYIFLCMIIILYLCVLVWRARRFMDVLFDYVCLGPYAKR